MATYIRSYIVEGERITRSLDDNERLDLLAAGVLVQVKARTEKHYGNTYITIYYEQHETRKDTRQLGLIA